MTEFQSHSVTQKHERNVRQVQSHGYRRKLSDYLETDFTLRIRECREREGERGR